MKNATLKKKFDTVQKEIIRELGRRTERVRERDFDVVKGRLRQVIGTTVESLGPPSSVGDFCWILGEGNRRVPSEVVGFKENHVIMMPYTEMAGIQTGSPIVSSGAPLKIGVGKKLLGRVLDGFGNPIDNKGPFEPEQWVTVTNVPPSPLSRSSISKPMPTGIRALDGLITVGMGQRIGIFAGSGVGKSTTLGMIARNASVDVNVIALIGERGREVPEFLERDLTDKGLEKSVVVVVTSDKPPLLRIKGALCATSIAEYFRDLGLNVLLMMDSATRIAMAQREVGLAVGEPPTTRGYTPSVFALLPQLLERAGTSEKGTITGIYTVLVEADDMNDPIADSMRSILDGHVVLSRALAEKNHYPCIDVLASISRVMSHIITPDHKKLSGKFRRTLARYNESEDLINIGAYIGGSNPEIDYAITKIEGITRFLQQDVSEFTSFEDTKKLMAHLFSEIQTQPQEKKKPQSQGGKILK